MKKIIAALFISSVLIFSCNEKKDNPAIEEVEKEVVSTESEDDGMAKLTLVIKAKFEDKLQVFHREDNNNFGDKASFYRDMKGNWATQTFVYNFKTEYLPAHFRIDFGAVKDQEVEFDKIIFESGGNVLEIPKNEIYTLFNPSDWASVEDPAAAKFKSIEVDGRTDPKIIMNTITNERLIAL